MDECRKIPSFEDYSAISNGIIIGKKGGIMRPTLDKDGYLVISIRLTGSQVRKYRSVHRHIANTFLPNPMNLPHVNHKNGIKTDNRVENLEWCTVSHNNKHAFLIGLRCAKGVMNSNAKLSEEDIRLIRFLSKKGISQSKIGREFGIKRESARDIIKRKNWAHVL